MHIQYDAALSREEAEASFDKAVAKFIKENGNAARASTEWYYKVQTHNDTDGNVWARVNFVTDQGHRHLAWMKLDHAWPYNDHEGGWGVIIFLDLPYRIRP